MTENADHVTIHKHWTCAL